VWCGGRRGGGGGRGGTAGGGGGRGGGGGGGGGGTGRPDVRSPPVAPSSRPAQRFAIEQQHIQPAVAVVIQEGPARAHRLRKVAVAGSAVDVLEVDAGLPGDVRKLHACARG